MSRYMNKHARAAMMRRLETLRRVQVYGGDFLVVHVNAPGGPLAGFQRAIDRAAERADHFVIGHTIRIEEVTYRRAPR